jgi:hypothetical protein
MTISKETVFKLIVTICYHSIVLKVSRLSMQDSGIIPIHSYADPANN